jgi:hypothetical protein
LELTSIIINESYESSDALRQAYDTRLSSALVEFSSVVALHLRPELPAGIALLAWIDRWNKQFVSVNKHLIAVAGMPQQYQILELSHPDQGLCYVGSAAEVQAVADRLLPKSPAKPGEGAPPPPLPSIQIARRSSLVPIVEKAESAIGPEPAVQEQNAPAADAPGATMAKPAPITISSGRISSVAGEYICNGCGVARMWLKGDTAGKCSNPECSNPEAGWTLTWELF